MIDSVLCLRLLFVLPLLLCLFVVQTEHKSCQLCDRSDVRNVNLKSKTEMSVPWFGGLGAARRGAEK